HADQPPLGPRPGALRRRNRRRAPLRRAADGVAAMSAALWIGPVPYDAEARGYLDRSDHYLDNSPPGALYAVGVRRSGLSLIASVDVGEGPLLGLCVVGRPVARALPQDGSV